MLLCSELRNMFRIFFKKKNVAVTLKKEKKSNDLIINPGVTYFSETSMSLNTNCFNVQNVLITFFKKHVLTVFDVSFFALTKQ